MPKQTFLNLPKQKKDNMIEAAEEEFARVPLFEASIANIVRKAGIPRGSFYQYFDDKEDVYFYLLEKRLYESKVYFIKLLKKHDGDIVDAITEMHHNFLEMMPDQEERNFLKNAILFATHKVENSITDMFSSTRDNQHYKRIMKLIDKQKLNIKEEQDVFSILQIISAVAFHNFIEKLSLNLSDHEAITKFENQMNLIKHGIYRKE